MIAFLDSILNRITMYRLAIYELLFLLFVAGVLGYAGVLSFPAQYLAFSVVFIFCISWLSNKVFALAFSAASNVESVWITAFILALIITPPTTWFDWHYLPLAFWASAWSMASKYIFAIRGKHIFNPAALGVAMTSLVLGLSASWWAGTLAMAPFVLLGGLLIVRKLRRFDLWFAFMGTFVAGILYFALDHRLDIALSLNQSLITAPALFFGTVMLTEPATAPQQKLWRILYGMGIGLLFLPNVAIGSFYFTPELALLAGNIGAYIVGPKYKLALTLKRAVRLSADVYEFVFVTPRPLSFAAGQYMEWTLPHANSDSRSIRRYFTLASSPTESEVKLGVKFYDPSSTFKKALLAMPVGSAIVAGGLAGGFTLPRNKKEKLAFIAGGIGVTPFRSMVQYLLDTREARDIVILYSNKVPEDVVYKEIFGRALQEVGLKTVYAFTDKNIPLPPGAVRKLDADTIVQKVPDYAERTFYISGPQRMVDSFKATLLAIGIRRSRIKTDYFPGFA